VSRGWVGGVGEVGGRECREVGRVVERGGVEALRQDVGDEPWSRETSAGMHQCSQGREGTRTCNGETRDDPHFPGQDEDIDCNKDDREPDSQRVSLRNPHSDAPRQRRPHSHETGDHRSAPCPRRRSRTPSRSSAPPRPRCGSRPSEPPRLAGPAFASTTRSRPPCPSPPSSRPFRSIACCGA
jgi:hypothetical protein